MDFITDPRYAVKWAKLLFEVKCIETVCCLPRFNDNPYSEAKHLPKLPDSIEINSGVLAIQPGVRLVGHKWLLGEDEKFCCDEVFSSSRIANMFNSDRDTPIKINAEGEFSYIPGRRKIFINEKIGIAVSSEPSNWGSFIFRILPKVALLKTLGCQKILVYCSHTTQRQAIKSLGFDDSDIICHYPENEYVLDGGAIYPMTLQSSGYLSTFARIALSNFKKTNTSKFGEKIYITRGNATKRKCVNETDVISMLDKHGFTVVYPGDLSFFEQVELFSGAKFVIGPSGAAMFNVAFCKPGTHVIDIESQRAWTYAHCSLFSSLDLAYGIFWGKPVEDNDVHAPFTIDCNALEERVKKCLSVM